MIKKIRTEELVVGMYVADFNTPWLNHPFLRSQKTLRSTKEIQFVLDHGITEVLIDTSKGKDSPKSYAPSEEGDLPARMSAAVTAPRAEGDGDLVEEPSDEDPFEEDLREVKDTYDRAMAVVRSLFGAAVLGRPVDAEAAQGAVESLIGPLFSRREALLGLVRLKAEGEYLYHHSLNVALLCLGLGSQLGILDSELLRLGLGALLHDVGKARVPQHLLSRPGPLNAAEREAVRSHAARGAGLILETADLPDECSAVALNHHERFDASGYPRGLGGLAIGRHGLIAAIADVYDALTSDQAYQRGITGHEALRRAYQWGGTAFQPVYVQKFIQCLGIYPTGSIVRLDTDEIGVVLRQNRDQPLRPFVRVALGRAGQPLDPPEDRDLRAPDPLGSRPFDRSIAAALRAADAPVSPEVLLAPAPRKSRFTLVVGRPSPTSKN